MVFSRLIHLTGFPYPENSALATHLEQIVRLNGGVPATIGVLDGVARIGLSAQELTELTSSAGKPETRKISRRDLADVLGRVSMCNHVLSPRISKYLSTPRVM